VGHLLLVIRRGPFTLPPSPLCSRTSGAATSLFAGIIFMSVSFSCAPDPVKEREIAALGGETPGVPHGPLHRPGQPCGLCHGADGPDNPEFSLAGTLYRSPSSRLPLAYATIHFIDSTGEQHTVESNCAGNFYVLRSEWSPSWPIWSKIEYGDGVANPTTVVEMTSAVFRETSCSTCHTDPASPSTVGHLYLAEDESTLPETPCR